MKNKMLKITTFFAIMLVIVSLFSIVFAANEDLLQPGTISGTSTDTSGKVGTLMGQILGIVQVIAMGVAIIMLIVLAIKYISAAPSEKADIKKGMITYVVGAVLLFGATAILEFIKTFTSNL